MSRVVISYVGFRLGDVGFAVVQCPSADWFLLFDYILVIFFVYGLQPSFVAAARAELALHNSCGKINMHSTFCVFVSLRRCWFLVF